MPVMVGAQPYMYRPYEGCACGEDHPERFHRGLTQGCACGEEAQKSHVHEPAAALPAVSSDAGIFRASILMDETIVQQLLGLFNEEESAPVLIPQRQDQTARSRARPRVNHLKHYRAALNGLDVSVDAHNMGCMECECRHCGTLFFTDKGIKRDGMFTMSCMRGKVHAPPLGDCPQLLYDLLTGDGNNCTDYRQFIRNYNAFLLFTSFYSWTVHHLTSGVAYLPEVKDPGYNQLYFIDVYETNAAHVYQHNTCQLGTLQDLEHLLSEINPLAQIHKLIHQVMAAEEEDACQKGQPLRQVTLTLKQGLGKDPNVYNLPAALNEVATIFVCDLPPMRNETRKYPKDKPAQFISPLNVLADPMIYPLLFLCGEHGYMRGVSHSVIVSAFGSTVTCKQYYAFHTMQRCSFSILHNSGKLFQKYIVDAYCKAESFRIWFIRQNQNMLRVDEYLDLHEHVKRVADSAQFRVGKLVIVPSSFHGSESHMYQCYQDSCGPSAHCFRNSSCRFHFPEAFCGETLLHYYGFVQYSRPDKNLSVTIGTKEYNNRHVVPYSPYVLHKYQCHTNIEISLLLRATRYPYKYIHKGNDSAVFQVGDIVRDEVTSYLDCRYVRSSEACWRLLVFKMADNNIIVRFALHLENRQAMFIQDNDVAGSFEMECEKHTHITAFFHYNSEHKLLHLCGTSLCGSIPWRRVVSIPFPGFIMSALRPMRKPLCLCLLLHNVRGPTSVQDLRTVRHAVHPIYMLACMDMLLLDRDDIYQMTMYEAARWIVPGR
ncbi:hypothetical protein PR048_015651 [Dryococelus australis]|uniref:Helitron helicase-like domain-containing protein n=1 Tax=Dryococelus australis TaxID=614101 RepID=A0ABQ9HHI6_9NEOP|nr:hypothetical protein PR048_015651 [Dryococelus australis]